MKNHKTIREVSHAWAYAANEEGGAVSSDSFSYTGGELFSYNTIIAKRIQTKSGEICLMNDGTYSVTTSRHQHLARLAVACPTLVGAWEDASRGGDVFSEENIIKSYSWKLVKETENLAKARRQSTRTIYTAAINETAVNLKKLIEYKIIKKSALTTQLKKLLLIRVNPAGLAVLKLAAEKELKKKLKANAVKIKESIANFRSWKSSHITSDARAFCGGDLIRYIMNPAEGEEGIRTSQGVSMLIADALILYKMASHCRANATAWVPSSVKLAGQYRVESIDAKGNTKVGCHYFKFEEIERCYQKEYLPTFKN
ncbi:hypothetical protein UFOVP1451_32 [uncultured Caudovirales phage]|uniref:DUF8033 domain-containing protein n=1 Tax=uncultured Caudovirales phage TaxID=2100421 RepID=A0A6J5SGW8_9CAUD|nr:hypothetical protein UFOVP1451_32 [uncultured Caudovirales phage]